MAESKLACDPVLSLAAVKATAGKSLSNSSRHTVHNTHIGQNKKFCVFCKSSSHYVCNCENLMRSSRAKKKTFVLAKRLCWGCLREGHIKSDCRVEVKCGICKLAHPTALHFPFNMSNTSRGEGCSQRTLQDNSRDVKGLRQETLLSGQHEITQSVSHYIDQEKADKCSMIVPVYISHRDNPDVETLVYCLLDSQSDTTFIRSDVARSLGIKGRQVKL